MASAKEEKKDKAEGPSPTPAPASPSASDSAAATSTKISFADGSTMAVQELAPRAQRGQRGTRRGREEKEKDMEKFKTEQKERKLAKRPHVDMSGKEKESRPECKFEYLDHTADIQVHSWGASMREAFEGQALGMFGYMTELETIDMTQNVEVEAEGHDLPSLLYNFLQALLEKFHIDSFVGREVRIVKFDDRAYKIRAIAKGEEFSLEKHPQGTEIKAITYSNLTITEKKEENRIDIYVILDI